MATIQFIAIFILVPIAEIALVTGLSLLGWLPPFTIKLGDIFEVSVTTKHERTRQ